VTNRPLRPLAIVALLALGDYLLWHWSLAGNHDVIALLSGLTLTPLLIALVWLLVVSAARLFAYVAQRPRAALGAAAGASGARARRASAARRATREPARAGAAALAAATSVPDELGASGAAAAASPSSQLAA
jgi:predicted lipid-binding transport protein (Tim44 family)